MSTATETKPQSSTLSSKGMLIGGQWVESASGARLTVENPAKRAPIAEVPRANAADVERAVAAGAKAYAEWRKVAPRERGKALLKIAEAIQARAEELARTIALETGNALRTQARGEANMTADIFRYFGGLASELKGETLPLGEQVLSYTRREPLGVVGAIIPWNAPVMLGALKIAPALCAGNTMVMKAAEDAPLGVLLMAEICQQFLPPGVLNVLTGFGEECGGPLANHPGIAKLSLHRLDRGRQDRHARRRRAHRAGVARARRQEPVDRLSRRRPGLGGRRHHRRHALHPAEPELHRGLAPVPARGHLRFLPGQAREEDHGAQDRRSARREDRHRHHHQQQAVHQGLQVCRRGPEALRREAGVRRPAAQDRPAERGLLRPPDGVRRPLQRLAPGARGDLRPVLVAIRWSDEAEAIRMANDSHYGLAAYVWTHDIGAGLRTAHAIESGWVQVNQGGGQVPGMSYGGYKQSGIGREFSLEGMLDSFTQRKSVTVNLAV